MPTAQDEHELAPVAAEKRPASQMVQVAMLVAPVEAEYLPAAQPVHAVEAR